MHAQYGCLTRQASGKTYYSTVSTQFIVKYLSSGKVYVPIARKVSFTFNAVFADVSINNKPFSSAYACAS